jgi:hypothetical protein
MTEQAAAVNLRFLTAENMRFLRCFAVRPGVTVWRSDDGAVKQARGVFVEAVTAIRGVSALMVELSEDAAFVAGQTEDQALRAALENISGQAGRLGQSVATIGGQFDAAVRQCSELFVALAPLCERFPRWVEKTNERKDNMP